MFSKLISLFEFFSQIQELGDLADKLDPARREVGVQVGVDINENYTQTETILQKVHKPPAYVYTLFFDNVPRQVAVLPNLCKFNKA